MNQASQVIEHGGIIAYPTEAVFGLGCDPLNPQAVQHLLAIKQRPADKGLILIASDFEQLRPYVDITRLSPAQRDTLFTSWPGPHTWLLPCRPTTPPWLRGRHSSIAVRVTAHPIARALCQRTSCALTSTSANRSGQRAARTALQVRHRLGAHAVDYILHGPVGGQARPTEIRDIITGQVIRHG
ncbi:MAG: Sua5/YciO/YrdC/YwlC family protein [Gammaproteobacteria bacterium]|nr:Sua5/YciO/YrdC/YwlC family protein [Gammaproteobacteria bacterium]